MGALPSRESNEDPSTVFFANCGSHVVFHIPMTPHYFPAPDGLAFQQLFHARNNQSALYCFDMQDVSSVLPQQAAEAFREAQDEDWGAEAEEADPSVHYYDEEIAEKIVECGGAVPAKNMRGGSGHKNVGKHFKHSIEDPEDLYRVLIEEPTAGTLVDTDAEMCEIFEAEQKWRAAVAQEFAKAAKAQHAASSAGADEQNHVKDSNGNGSSSCSPAQGAENCISSSNSTGGNAAPAESCSAARPDPQNLPPPPSKFLYPLPHAIALRMTTEEEEEMRAEYCRLHKIPYVAPHFRDVKPGSTPPAMDAASLTQLGVPRTSASTCFVACPLPTPLPLVERRRYHFEDDPKYRDGRVHLVEEHGVLYHFAYFPKKRRHNTTASASAAGRGEGASSSSLSRENAAAAAAPVTHTPIVLDRCLHDVVYSEEPDTSVSNNKQLAAAAAAASPFGAPSTFSSEPEVAPAKRYGRCARCGARIEQRMDYTQLRRLKATRQQRRELRRAEEEWAKKQQQEEERLKGHEGGDESAEAAAQREAWAAFAAAREAEKKAGNTTRPPHRDHPNGSADDEEDGDDAPGSDNDLEVASHTERVEEEGETEFVINIAPVRIAGMDGLLPSRTRGTPWLRGYEHEDEALADAYVEQLEYKPPVMRTCRFIEGSVGDKIVNRAALVTMLSYRPMCRQAGLSNALTRPVWSTCVLSNIPYLQMVRETFFRAKAAVAEIDDKDMLLRRWLDVVDRENNFYNFINANLYMMRNFTPPERTVRQHEPADDTNSTTTTVGAASSMANGFGNGSVGTGHGNSIASSSVLGSPTGRPGAYTEGVDPTHTYQQQQQQQQHVPSATTAPPSQLSPSFPTETKDERSAVNMHGHQAGSDNAHAEKPYSQAGTPTREDAGGDVASSVSSLSSTAAAATTAGGPRDGLSTSDASMQSKTTTATVAHAAETHLHLPQQQPLLHERALLSYPHLSSDPASASASPSSHAKCTGDTTTAALAVRDEAARTAADSADLKVEAKTTAAAPVDGAKVSGVPSLHLKDSTGATPTTKSHTQSGIAGGKSGKPAELRSHHLLRDMEEATIGRPEGHGPRDVVDEDFEDDDASSSSVEGDIDDRESSGSGVIRGNDAAARAARRKEEKRLARKGTKSKSKKSAASTAATANITAPPASPAGAVNKLLETMGSPTKAAATISSKDDATRRGLAAGGVARQQEQPEDRSLLHREDTHADRSAAEDDNDDGGEASGRPMPAAAAQSQSQPRRDAAGRPTLTVPATDGDVAMATRGDSSRSGNGAVGLDVGGGGPERGARYRHNSVGTSDNVLNLEGDNDDDDDADLRMEEESRAGNAGGHGSATGTRTGHDRHGRESTGSTSAKQGAKGGGAEVPAATAAHEPRASSSSSPLMPPPPRIEVPPRPNFQLFSSRLEPHAPLSLYSLFDYDANADPAAATPSGSHHGSPAGGNDLAEGDTTAAATTTAAQNSNTIHSNDLSSSLNNANNNSISGSNINTGLPSYVQHDVLRENERRQAEPKSQRRPSHALYECGMLATTRGRSFLFLLREDCVHALLYYLSSAAAPIFIGAYIEPVDTTSVSYGGAVRLQKPSTVQLPVNDDAEGEAGEESTMVVTAMTSTQGESRRGGNRSVGGTVRGALDARDKEGDGEDGAKDGEEERLDRSRVIIGPVEGMEVMAEYYKSKGLITCFSVSDVERIAPGPSAAHRLRKMILPSAHPPLNNTSQNNLSLYWQSEERALARRQAREVATYGHTFTYAAHEFCDGDLVVYNFDERKWEHYEHVQLRRRFAAKAAAVAAARSPFHGGGGCHSSSSPMGRSSAASSSFNSTNALGFMSANVGPGGLRGEGGVGGVSGRVHDDVAVVVDGSVGGASSVADASMSARLLCVGLDELLLSWTKWVVDNRFYEDRSDLGWLNLPDGSPIQLGGRYFLWSFRHNHQRYFYGVIPKFAKGRLRRQKLMERNRKKKKETDTPRGSANRAGSNTNNNGSSHGASHKETKLKERAGGKSKSRSPFTTAGNPGGRTTPRPHSTGSNGPRGGGGGSNNNSGRGRQSGGGASSTHADPSQLSAGLSSLHGGGNSSSRGSSTQHPQQQPHVYAPTQATSSGGSRSNATSGTSAFAYSSSQQQQQQPYGNATYSASNNDNSSIDIAEGTSSTPHPHTRSDSSHSSPMLATSALAASHRGSPHTAAPHNSSSFPASHSQALYPPSHHQQQWQSNSPLYGTSQPSSSSTLVGAAAGAAAGGATTNSSFPSVRVGTNAVCSALATSVPGAGPAVTTTRDVSARRAPLLGPPPTQPRGLSSHHSHLHDGGATAPRSPLLTSPAQLNAAGASGGPGRPNYYYQYGGNTFIQDGKRHENEYYPPLPPNQPFHPATEATAAKLVPLPPPSSGRGAIPAMFRYYGPAGHPSHTSRSSTLPRPGMPLPLAQPATTAAAGNGSSGASMSGGVVFVGGPASMASGAVHRPLFHPASAPSSGLGHGAGLNHSPPVAGAATVTSVGGNPATPAGAAQTAAAAAALSTSSGGSGSTTSGLTVRVRRRGGNAMTPLAPASASTVAVVMGIAAHTASTGGLSTTTNNNNNTNSGGGNSTIGAPSDPASLSASVTTSALGPTAPGMSSSFHFGASLNASSTATAAHAAHPALPTHLAHHAPSSSSHMINNNKTASFPASPLLQGEAPPPLHGGSGAALSIGSSSMTTNPTAPTVSTAATGGAASVTSGGGGSGGESGGVKGTRPLSPTSMLPAHLINEGSKTKGESLLRVDEDMYVQREAFRWNPYASTKWSAGKHETSGSGE